MPITLPEVCKQMKDHGCEWGSFTSPDFFSSVTPGPYKMSKESQKPPAKALYFSRIEPAYVDEESEGSGSDTTERLSLEWYNWLMGEDFRVEEYSTRSLVFAKFDMSRLTSEADSRFGKNGEWHRESRWQPVPHWQKVSENYAGIHVQMSGKHRDVFPMWDVETVCVWDPTAIKEVYWFRATGEPWEYNF